MQKRNYIAIKQLCTHYNIPISFIHGLDEFELLEIVYVEKEPCIHEQQLIDVERIMRLHFDLEINMEGIDAIYNLLKQVDDLQNEISVLSNKLSFYE